MRLRYFALVLAAMIIAAGCDTATDANSNTPPKIATIAISVPAANFSDTCNAPAYSYASLAQAMVQYATLYAQLPGGTNNNGVWTWSMTDDGITVTITARKLTDGRYEWKIVLNGTDGTDTYANWTALEGTVAADGKSGSLTFYDDSPTPSTNADVIVMWSTTGTTTTIDFESVQDDMKFVLITNGTSGEVSTYHKVGSAWAGPDYHGTWTAPNALATC
jgi:hypothetical protein